MQSRAHTPQSFAAAKTICRRCVCTARTMCVIMSACARRLTQTEAQLRSALGDIVNTGVCVQCACGVICGDVRACVLHIVAALDNVRYIELVVRARTHCKVS
jgi:hypothetical protein